MQIVICDDEDSTSRAWQSELESVVGSSDFEVIALGRAELRATISDLEARQAAARQSANGSVSGSGRLDDVSIMIVDFDLLELAEGTSSANETGERIAYLARAYSSCDYIVALNQFNRDSSAVFDLTLRGHPQSFADLNVASSQIGNPALWCGDRGKFRPWNWPCLKHAPTRARSRVESIVDALDQPILNFLGLDGDRVFPHFTPEQLGFLSFADPKEATFRSLVLNSQAGLRGKDRQRSDELVARIAASRVHKWLERMVLPGQNILVDEAHLAVRFPSLVANGSSNLDDWQGTTKICGGSTLSMPKPNLAEGRFDFERWLSRPAWLWPEVQHNEEIVEVSNPFEERLSEFRFAEDLSMFRPHDEVRSFTADLESSWRVRYVVDPYELAPDDPAVSPPFSVTDVSYQPAIQFAI
jgi:hypothetical protein